MRSGETNCTHLAPCIAKRLRNKLKNYLGKSLALSHVHIQLKFDLKMSLSVVCYCSEGSRGFVKYDF